MLISPLNDHAETNAGQSMYIQQRCTTISPRMEIDSVRPQPDIKVRFLQLSPAGRHLPVKLGNHQCNSFRFGNEFKKQFMNYVG